MTDIVCNGCGHHAAVHKVIDGCMIDGCDCGISSGFIYRAHIEKLEVAIEAFRASNGRVGESLNKLEDELNELRFQD